MSDKILILKSRRFEFIFPDHLLEQVKSLGDVVVSERIEHDDPEADAKLKAVMNEVKPDILVTGWGTPLVTGEVIDQNPQGKYIHHTAGTVRAVIERDVFTKENGPVVSNWGNTVAPSVGEAGLMMTLAGLRRVASCQAVMHQDKGFDFGDVHAPITLFDQKVGSHGLGAIAQEYVKLLKPFRCQVSAFSPRVPDEVFEQLGVTRANSLEELYSENPIIACHAGSTPETYHIVNKDILARIPDGGLLVNTARGEVIDTDALIAELKSGRIHAALDVYEPEPLPEDSALRGLRNCLLMPHTGGPTSDWTWRMGVTCIENIKRFQGKEKLDGEMSLSVYDRST